MSGGLPRILAVLVLYKVEPAESAAFTTLGQCVEAIPGAQEAVHALVYDNSPEAQGVPASSLLCEYRHDGSNPGLARAYQIGLERARQLGIEWLLLLDQDTRLTAEYLREVFAAVSEQNAHAKTGAVAPKLLQERHVLSPHWPVGKYRVIPFDGACGLIEPRICVYNSGAVMRVRAMESIGGFPQDFPLDCLDHAVFTRLQRAGYRVFLLRSALQHNLGSLGADVERNLYRDWRLRSILAAESRFYRQLGTSRERMFFAWRRLRLGISMARRREFGSLRALWRCTFG